MVSIRALREDDHRSSFSSGNDDLDRFFRKFAGLNQFAEHIGVTYVAVDDKDRIIGFATLAAAVISAKDFPSSRARKLQAYPLPALRLARLAVSVEAQGKGIGADLLRYTFLLALEQAVRVGCAGVVVDAKAESTGFYERFGFERQEAVEGQAAARPEPIPMVLSLRAIRAAVEA